MSIMPYTFDESDLSTAPDGRQCILVQSGSEAATIWSLLTQHSDKLIDPVTNNVYPTIQELIIPLQVEMDRELELQMSYNSVQQRLRHLTKYGTPLENDPLNFENDTTMLGRRLDRTFRAWQLSVQMCTNYNKSIAVFSEDRIARLKQVVSIYEDTERPQDYDGWSWWPDARLIEVVRDEIESLQIGVRHSYWGRMVTTASEITGMPLFGLNEIDKDGRVMHSDPYQELYGPIEGANVFNRVGVVELVKAAVREKFRTRK